MSALPEALHPWRQWLGWLEANLAGQLGPLLQRMHPLLGPYRTAVAEDERAAGLGGLARRGPYPRLLASEWLLAGELPEEFLRRAASGEHLFLAPQPQARRVDGSIVALFDTGPLQLGAPRLAHVALWILLARRAQQARSRFHWGSLQSPGELHEARTPADLQRLLWLRSGLLAHDKDLAAWSQTLDHTPAGGERWFIGAPQEAAGLPVTRGFTHQISLTRDLPGRALEVCLREHDARRELRLPLPPAPHCAGLLRPRAVRRGPPAQGPLEGRAVALYRPPVLALDGRRVAVALFDERAALVFGLPTGGRLPTPTCQRWRSGHEALGMLLMGRQLRVLQSGPDELRFSGSSLSIWPRPPPSQFRAQADTAAWLPLAWLHGIHGQRVCVIDHQRRLFYCDSLPGSSHHPAVRVPLQPLAEGVLGMAQQDSHELIYAQYADGAVELRRLTTTVAAEPLRRLFPAPPDARVLFGKGGLYAVRLAADETWHIASCRDPTLAVQVRLPTIAPAVGLTRGSRGGIALITLAGRRLQQHFVDGGSELLYEAPAVISACSMSPTTAHVALITRECHLIVLSGATGEQLLSVQTWQPRHERA